MRQHLLTKALVGAFALAVAACSSSPVNPNHNGNDGSVMPGQDVILGGQDVVIASDQAGDSVAPPPGSVTFHRDVQPITQANCIKCHYAGGIGPFPLTTYD